MRKSHIKILELMSQGIFTPSALCAAMNMTRLSMDSNLGRMMHHKLIRELPVVGEVDKSIYIPVGLSPEEVRATRVPVLNDERARVLSALKSNTAYHHQELSHFLWLSEFTIRRCLDGLVKLKYVSEFRVKNKRFFKLKAKGLAHPQYDRLKAKAPGSDIVAEIGFDEADFISIMDSLFDVTAADLDCVFSEGDSRTYRRRTKTVLRHMKLAGLVTVTNPSSPPKDRRYALTPHGEDLASVLYETAPLLDIGYVWGLISAQRQKALDRAALSKAKVSVAPQSENPKPETSLNPQQLLVLRTLGGLEELSDAEIYARTSSHFAYEGFVNVALSRLEQLHLVRREYRVHDGELCWACTAEGYGTIRREAFVVIRESAVVMQEPTYSKPEKVKRIPEPRLNSKHLALLQTLSDREELTVAEIFSYVSGTFSHQGFVSVTLRSLAGYGYARSHYKQRNGRTDLCWSCTAEGLSALGFGLIRQRAEAAQDCVV